MSTDDSPDAVIRMVQRVGDPNDLQNYYGRAAAAASSVLLSRSQLPSFNNGPAA